MITVRVKGIALTRDESLPPQYQLDNEGEVLTPAYSVYMPCNAACSRS